MRLIAALLLLALAFSTVASASEKMVVNVGIYDNPPMISLNKKGEAQGIGVDILDYVADKENLKINYIFGTWNETLNRLKQGEIDALFPIAYSKERAKIYQYNEETILTNWGQVYTQPELKIQSIPDLNKKTIAVLEDDIYFRSDQGLNRLSKAFNVKCAFIFAESYKEIIEMVSTKKADAGLVSRLFGQLYENKYRVTRTPILIHPIEIRFAMPLGSQKGVLVADLLDKHLKKLKDNENSIYHQSLDRWMGVSGIKKYFPYLKWIFLGLGIPLIIAVLTAIYLELKIKRKTRELLKSNVSLKDEIEERKRIQDELAKSEQKFSNLFHSSNDPIVIFNYEGYIIDVNNELLSQMGYTFDELVGRRITYVFSDAETSDGSDLYRQDEKSVYERDMYRKNGDKFTAEISVSSFKTPEGPLVQMIIRDVTVRRKTQQILAQKKRDLEKRVQEEVEHNRMQEQLLMQQSKLASMGQMINAIAHQWRQPLTTIGLYIQDVEDAYDYSELNREYIESFRNKSMEQISYMSKTIDDFRNFFKPDKEKEIFDLCEIIREVLSLVHPQLINNSVQLAVYYMDEEVKFTGNSIEIPTGIECVTCYGYPNEFKQVLLNLISNSRDAILEARSNNKNQEQGIIKVIVTPEGETINITVSDNGTGIPEDIRGRIFEPYFSTKDEGQGVGIGLYMSKVIIENNMEGRIICENTEEGASFTVTLNKASVFGKN
ncbi:ATP-binding protein [Limisalsivibrio acetivorans]|uniref:ATP-binding protein n=1 Tax=Limisalsivibrio acetivorans TaxID=1304888 RepID=UPI0003B34B85|nr:ATP-binding protein [Limisalsivibrio acetivorans]